MILLINYKDEIIKIFCEADDFCKKFSLDIFTLKHNQISFRETLNTGIAPVDYRFGDHNNYDWFSSWGT